jgi:hypothetical protein
MLRLLIGIYAAVALAEFALAGVILALTFLSLGKVNRGPSADQFVEGLFIAATGVVMGLLPLLAAVGLWRRWRYMRLVLMGLSCWTLLVCAFAAAVALAMLTGVTDGRILGTNDPPAKTLAISSAFSAFSAFQFWVLMRPAVRDSFRTVQRSTLECRGVTVGKMSTAIKSGMPVTNLVPQPPNQAGEAFPANQAKEWDVVDLWVCSFPSAAAVEEYFFETYGEGDEIPISRFAADMGERFYDHDFVYRELHDPPARTLEEALEPWSNLSWAQPKMLEAFQASPFSPFNVFLVAFGREIERPKSVHVPGRTLHYLGRFEKTPADEAVT